MVPGIGEETVSDKCVFVHRAWSHPLPDTHIDRSLAAQSGKNYRFEKENVFLLTFQASSGVHGFHLE